MRMRSGGCAGGCAASTRYERRLPAPRPADEVRQLLVADARPGAVLHVDGADHHYLARVLRLRPSAVIPVADAAGRRARATVLDMAGGRVRLLVDSDRGERDGHAATPVPDAVILVQALPRGTLMDRVVRQATELGVARIVPVVAERTQGRADPAAQERRRQRWQRIARQAAQQSGSAPPPIDSPVPVRRYLERTPAPGLGLLFQPGAALLHAGAPPGAVGAVAAVGAVGAGGATRAGSTAGAGGAAGGGGRTRDAGHGEAQGAMDSEAPAGRRPVVGAGPPLAVRCAVGPEGGFAPAEEALFREHGFHAAGLPGGILRVDTAAVAALTAARQFLASLRAH